MMKCISAFQSRRGGSSTAVLHTYGLEKSTPWWSTASAQSPTNGASSALESKTVLVPLHKLLRQDQVAETPKPRACRAIFRSLFRESLTEISSSACFLVCLYKALNFVCHTSVTESARIARFARIARIARIGIFFLLLYFLFRVSTAERPGRRLMNS